MSEDQTLRHVIDLQKEITRLHLELASARACIERWENEDSAQAMCCWGMENELTQRDADLAAANKEVERLKGAWLKLSEDSAKASAFFAKESKEQLAAIDQLRAENERLAKENALLDEVSDKAVAECAALVAGMEKQTGTYSDPMEDRSRAMAARNAITQAPARARKILEVLRAAREMRTARPHAILQSGDPWIKAMQHLWDALAALENGV